MILFQGAIKKITGSPALRATALDPLTLDLDATIVTSHSDKEQDVGNYKVGYGFAPFVASIYYGAGNGTGEILAVLMRPGNTGANCADDHIKVFTQAIAQLPEDFYGQQGKLIGQNILVRADSAGPHENSCTTWPVPDEMQLFCGRRRRVTIRFVNHSRTARIPLVFGAPGWSAGGC